MRPLGRPGVTGAKTGTYRNHGMTSAIDCAESAIASRSAASSVRSGVLGDTPTKSNQCASVINASRKSNVRIAAPIGTDVRRLASEYAACAVASATVAGQIHATEMRAAPVSSEVERSDTTSAGSRRRPPNALRKARAGGTPWTRAARPATHKSQIKTNAHSTRCAVARWCHALSRLIPFRTRHSVGPSRPTHWATHSEHGHREHRAQRVVGGAQPTAQHPHHRPQHLVCNVAMEIQQHLELGSAHRDHLGAAVRDRVCGSLAAVEHGHLAEHRARLEHRQRFLTRTRNLTADADLALDDDEQPVAWLAFVEDLLARCVRLFLAQFRYTFELVVRQPAENLQVAQHVDRGRHRLPRAMSRSNLHRGRRGETPGSGISS